MAYEGGLPLPSHGVGRLHYLESLRVRSGTGNVCEIPAKRISGRDIAAFQKLSCSGIDSTSCRLYLGPDNARQTEILL